MKLLSRFLCMGWLLSAIVVGSWVAPAQAEAAAVKTPAKSGFDDMRVVVDKYCIRCHSGRRSRGGLNFDRFKDQASVLKNLKVWEKVYEYLHGGMMPPKGKPKPTPPELDKVYAWLDSDILKVDCTGGQKDPGRVTIRRLNRAEYNNTIRDLVGVTIRPADDFPSDDVGYGFDNIGDVLSMPPILTEKYLASAEQVVAAAWKSDAARKRILISLPANKKEYRQCALKILRAFAGRAWRRPATDEEVNRLFRFVDSADKDGEPFESGIQYALEAVLTSPHFLFRVEIDKADGDAPHPINDWELATRLSYFLWSSMPDQELFDHARKADLHQPEVLEAQTRRMLKDPKAHALVKNFADQWLLIRNLKNATPDTALFPEFNDTLRNAMQKETEMYFENVVHEDRSILDFIDSNYTFVNEPLAKLYGIKGVKGNEFRKVSLTDGRRGGVLTQASILTVTSNPTRTSPVKRGKFILDNILGTPPPPPPPNVPELKEGKEVADSATLRQRMEQHRSNPACASCHQKMDPLGFGFENFDAIGAWRNRDGKNAIDPSGVLPDGASFKGPAELKKILKARQQDFAHCLAEKMLTYALGRGLERPDRCVVEEVTRNVVQHHYVFSSLVLGIVKSEPFLMRRGKRGG